MKWLKLCLLTVCFLAAGAGLLVSAAGLARRKSGVRVERDLQLKTVTMEEMKALEEREKDGMTGLIGVAAWRFGEAGTVSEPLSGKKEGAGIAWIYGSMPLAFPANVLCGSYDRVMEADDCVLTGELSWSLFGSVNTENCFVSFEGNRYRIAAVIEKKEKILFLPEKKGAAQMAAFAFQERDRVKEKMEALGFGEEQ